MGQLLFLAFSLEDISLTDYECSEILHVRSLSLSVNVHPVQ
jgi:hypothetical protein